MDVWRNHASLSAVCIILLNTFYVHIFPSVSAHSGSLLSSSGSVIIDGAAGSGSVVPADGFAASSSSVMYQAETMHVRINEVQWMGTDLSTADEWIELLAVATGSALPVDLAGWTLTVQKETGEAVIADLTGLTIGSGQYLVVSNFSAASSRLQQEPALVSSSLSIPNTKLLLRLRDGSGSLIDEVDDYIGAPFAGSNPSGGTKASMERVSPFAAGTMKENWVTAATSNGFDPGANVLGTPGNPNGSVAVPDTIPPPEVLQPYAYAWSGSVIVGWQPAQADDVAGYRVISDQVQLDVALSVTEVLLSGTGTMTTVTVQSVDTSGNASTGSMISIQTLRKLKISELLPSPHPGEYEWVELSFSGSGTLPLHGLSLESGSRVFSFKNIVQSLNAMTGSSVLLLPAHIIGLQLPNAGGTVRLRAGGFIVDELSYGELPAGVSLARLQDDSATPSCVPTPGHFNDVASPDPRIIAQDGSTTGTEPITLNLMLATETGSLERARCQWDFGDGYMPAECNPPSHRMNTMGDGIISVSVTDYCGNTMERTFPYSIIGKPISLKEETESTSDVCAPTTFSGILLTEFLADPEGDEEEGEWMEIRNVSGGFRQLCGWYVDDQIGGSDPYPLGRRVIGSGEYMLLPRTQTKIALNNDHDTVRLIAPLPEGGTGVVMLLPYQKAKEGEAMAVREDGQWLRTGYPTPGSANRFAEVDTTLGASPVVLHAALPNPKGPDEFDEYIELENLTMYPQWLNGWHIEQASGKQLSLEGNVIPRKTTLRIKLRKKKFTLTNKQDALRLIDPSGTVRSVLAWKNAKEGYIVRPFHGERTEVDQTVSAIHPDSLSGVSIPDSVSFYSIVNEGKNMISSLIKNKKIELEIDTNLDGSYIWADGVSIESLLLRMGYAYTSADAHPRQLEYAVYEDEARQNKRGIWSTEEMASVINHEKHRDELLARYRQEGLSVHLSPEPGLVSSGTLITARTNLPADVFISIGTGSTITIGSGFMLNHDATITAFAVLDAYAASGEEIRSSVATHEYSILRERYPSCITISEVYPSPLTGEHEWVELYNKCDQEINLLGWTMDDVPDGGSKPFTLPAMHIRANGYVVLSGAALRVALNNTGDAVQVRTPLGNLSNILWFGSIKKGIAVTIAEGEVCQTVQPTPGGENVCVKPTKKPSSQSKVAKVMAGIGMKYVSMFWRDKAQSEECELCFIEGLNMNIRSNNVFNFIPLLLVLIISGAISILVAIWLLRRY